MHPLTRANQDLYRFTEEIHYPSRCSYPGCIDEIIPDPNGIGHCFKHCDYNE